MRPGVRANPMSQNYDPNGPAQEHAPQAGRDNFPGHDQGYPAGQDEFACRAAAATGAVRFCRRTAALTARTFQALADRDRRGRARRRGDAGRADRHHGFHRGGTLRPRRRPRCPRARSPPGWTRVWSTWYRRWRSGCDLGRTGIVLSSDGEVLTNNHVIGGATLVKVTDIGNGQTSIPPPSSAMTRPRTWRWCSCWAPPA